MYRADLFRCKSGRFFWSYADKMRIMILGFVFTQIENLLVKLEKTSNLWKVLKDFKVYTRVIVINFQKKNSFDNE